jgi:hypothetical protein
VPSYRKFVEDAAGCIDILKVSEVSFQVSGQMLADNRHLKPEHIASRYICRANGINAYKHGFVGHLKS